MVGLVTKGIGGFYYVKASSNNEIIECRGRGSLKEEKGVISVGDEVEFSMVSANQGVIEDILPRKNHLIRPPISNVDVVALVFACKKPKLNTRLIDRFLLLLEMNSISPMICITKTDLEKEERLKELAIYYKEYPIHFVSAKEGSGIEDLRKALKGKKFALAGPSGCGKSTLTNILTSSVNMEVGKISDKTKRGRHTTRHVEIFQIDDDTMIFDTPGFTSLELPKLEDGERLDDFLPEIGRFRDGCRFDNCNHYKEPDCNVRAKVSEGVISQERYNGYIELLQELRRDEL